MEVFRLVRAKYGTDLSGKGAALKGARWNSVGVEIIYTAENRSLAMAEVAVHLTLATMPTDFQMVCISIPEKISILELNEKDLPADWQQFPHAVSTQLLGDEFVRNNKYLVFKVPSVITQGDYNYLINPRHKDFSLLSIKSIEKFPFEKRLIK